MIDICKKKFKNTVDEGGLTPWSGGVVRGNYVDVQIISQKHESNYIRIMIIPYKPMSDVISPKIMNTYGTVIGLGTKICTGLVYRNGLLFVFLLQQQ